MEHFVSAALGLDIVSRIAHLSELPTHHQDCLARLQREDRLWAAWSTTIGPVTVSARI